LYAIISSKRYRSLWPEQTYNSASAENKKEIEADMHLYPDNKGVGRHTSLDFQIIVQAVSEEWKVLGGGDADLRLG
jgi:hypothetical protein